MTLNKELLSLQEEFCPFYQHCEQNGLASRQCEDGEKVTIIVINLKVKCLLFLKEGNFTNK